ASQGGAGVARGCHSVSAAVGQTGGVRGACAAHGGERDAERRDRAARRRDPHGAALAMAEGTSREPLDFAPPAIEVEKRADGSYLLRSPYAPEPYPDHLLIPLQRWAREAPDRALFAERGPDGAWRK